MTTYKFGTDTRIFCSAADDRVIGREDGASYCGVWINRELTAQTGQAE